MANNISHISQETAEEALFKVETQAKEPNLTKEQLTQWFANLEKHEDPKTTLSAPDLATQLLSRFGLQNAEQVMEFLGTESGKITFTMISRELMHEEAINKYLVEKNQEELLRQRKVLFVLLGLITSRDAEAKEVGYRIQEQIQKILKDNNAQNEKSKVKIPLLSPVAIVQAMIKTYNEAIEALDEQIVEVNAHITELDTELEELAQEAVHIQQHHDGLDTHMAVLNAYLKLPIFHTMPNNPHAYAQEQLIALGNKQKKIQAKIDNTQSENPDFERKNRMKLVVIQRLSDFHQEVALRHVPENEHPFTFETAVKLFMEQLRKAQKEGQQFGRYDTAMEGLKLQESGLSQVLKVKLNKKYTLMLN